MKPTRREFLAVGGGVAAGCAALSASGCHTNNARLLKRPATGGAVTLALAADAPELAKPGAALRLRPPGTDDTVIVWRDASGKLFASSIECTHFGCDVEVAKDASHLYCPCHGSAFESSGAVRKGPAKKPLRAYEVRETGGSIEIRGFKSS